MKRQSIDIEIEKEDTIESLAEAFDLTPDEFVSFNPYIRLYVGRPGYVVHIRLSRIISWEGMVHVTAYKSDAQIL